MISAKGNLLRRVIAANDYRVRDWNDRGLPPPPQGQHWSYINGNYVLIAAATGIITSILVNGVLSH
jgi:Ni/Co efflux regulator RcnB